MPDYEWHLDSKRLHDILGDESDMDFHHGFTEDEDEIAKMIEEELGTPPRRRREKKKVTVYVIFA
jgi:hypothetical protein